MKSTRLIMGMPVVLDIVGAPAEVLEHVFRYFHAVDQRFSTHKSESEVSRINRGEIPAEKYSTEMREVFSLAEQTARQSEGYFDIRTPQGSIDPSGLVKGWAINNAAQMIRGMGYTDFWVEIGGDIQTSGRNAEGYEWRVGIRNPFRADEIVKVLFPRGAGIATSGDYLRGSHIYDPRAGAAAASSIVSLTVVGPNVYEADRFATAAFAMGERGILFIESLPGFECYAIHRDGRATMTSGFSAYVDIPSPFELSALTSAH